MFPVQPVGFPGIYSWSVPSSGTSATFWWTRLIRNVW